VTVRSSTQAWLLVAVAILGISSSGPITAAMAAPILAIAFWRNLGAYIVFAAAWALLMSLASLALALLLGLFGSAPTIQSVVPLALMMIVMMSTSMYFTFRDSFLETGDNDAPGTPGGDAT
jgi:hypothetical protein